MKKVAVVGGGDTAMEEAHILSKFASKVLVIHRRDKLRASKFLQERAFKNSKIDFIWNSIVKEILGEEKVEGLRLKKLDPDEEYTLDCDAVFIAIGRKPNTEIFKGQLDMDENGYLLIDEGSTKTNIPGVFAAGDVSDHVYRQAITAAGMGCMAALDAERYLNE